MGILLYLGLNPSYWRKEKGTNAQQWKETKDGRSAGLAFTGGREIQSSSERTEEEDDIVTCKIIYVALFVAQFYLHGELKTLWVKIWG